MTVQPGPRATDRAAHARGAGRAARRAAAGARRGRWHWPLALQAEWALQPGAAVHASRPGTAPRTACSASCAPTATCAAQWSRHRGPGRRRRQHAAPVPGGRQRPTVPRRPDPHRRAAALRRGRRACAAARELPGKPATEQLLLDYQERLLKLGLFESVVIESTRPRPSPPQAPALVAVRELPLQQATVGVGYSDNTGLRASLEHTHRRSSTRRWIAHNKLQVGQDLSQLDRRTDRRTCRSDGWRNLLAGQLRAAWTATTRRASPGPARRPHAGHAAHRAADYLRVRRRAARDLGRRRRQRCAVAATTTGSGATSTTCAADARQRWSLQGGAGLRPRHQHRTRRQREERGHRPLRPRLRARAPATGRSAAAFYGTRGSKLGQVFVSEALSVPDTLLFRAGGDDSVRGYAYRSLGPELERRPSAAARCSPPASSSRGRSCAELPAFCGRVFVDAGNAADGWSDMRPVLGYGVGAALAQPGRAAARRRRLRRGGAEVPPALQRRHRLLKLADERSRPTPAAPPASAASAARRRGAALAAAPAG